MNNGSVRETIRQFGHQIIGVFPSEGEDGAPFAYTIGRTEKARPELLITGLPGNVAAQLLNDLAAYDDRHGLTAGQLLAPDTIINGLAVRVIAADPTSAQMLQAIHYYGCRTVTALQLLWPDKNGHLPDHPDYSQPASMQPLWPAEVV